MKLGLKVTPCTKINSKQISDVNVKPTTIKLSEIKIGENLWDRGIGKDFLRLDTINVTHKRKN